KFAMTDVQASLGLAQLPHLDEWIAIRSQQWSRYDEEFAELPLERPPEPAPGTVHARHLYQVTVTPDAPLSRDERPNRLRAGGTGEGLRGGGMGSGRHYPALPLHPHMRQRHGMDPGTCPAAVEASSRLLSLPIGPALTAAGQRRVSDAIHALLAAGR